MTNLLGKAMRWLGYCVAVIIIFAATLVSLTQLLAPYLNEHRADFSNWASELLHVPITIQQVTISWKRAEPEIEFRQVAVLNKQSRKPTFEIQKIIINVKLVESLFKRSLLPENIRIDGVQLTLHQKKSGQMNVEGLDDFVLMDNLTGGSVAGDAMSAWIFSQPNLELHHIEISYIPDKGIERSVSIADLVLQNTTTEHILLGKATLNQEMPMHATVHLQWQGATADIMHSTSQMHLYLYLEGISLPQWLSQKTWQQLKVKEGVGSAKFWITWDQGQLQNIQSQFQLYEMQVESLITKKTMSIPRINGDLGWRRDGENQVIDGKDILIDFPEHLWPTTQFSLTLLPEESAPKVPLRRKMKSFRIKADYLDLADSSELALASGLLSDSLKKTLLELDPKGEVRALDMQSGETIGPSSAEFSKLQLNAWGKFPGVKNLNGKLSWNDQAGKLTLDSHQATLTWDTLFSGPLQFDSISSDISWQKNADMSWMVQAKNFNVSNPDISMTTNMTLFIPKDESSVIQLEGDFSVPHVEKLEKYLPVKTFEAPFVNWLHNRFLSGQLTSGKISIQGKLSDFAREDGAMKFRVSTKVQDMEFDYAPGWPPVHHTYGNLIFSGHSMTADIESGQLMNVPLTKVHGFIPYIGPLHPQILDLNADINTDLAQGLRFIQQSPLRNSIGKDLAPLQLTGEMGLKLAFTIPLRTPDKSLVIGDISVTTAQLQIPSWNLKMEKMTGALHFTEQSIQVNQMKGQLFNEPFILNMNTTHESNKPPVINAQLQSKMTESVLEKWLNMPLTQFIKGEMPYTAELNIIPHKYTQSSQLIIRSNLKGLSINLPGIYGKGALEPRDFQFNVLLKQDQPLETKITYGKLLTAALTFDKSGASWEFQGGELRLGSQGQANWQSQPGLLVTGYMDRFDWNSWRTYFDSLSIPKNKTQTKSDSNSLIQYLRGIDLSAGQVPILGQTMLSARIQAQVEDNRWKINVTSPNIVGQIWIPIKDTKSVIQAKFQRLYLLETKEQEQRDPKTIPAISLTAEDVRFKDNDIGRVALDVAPNKMGLQIQKLNISTDFFTLNAKGQWSSQKRTNQTDLTGTLTTNNVSQVLNHWGLGSAALVATQGNMTFDINWLSTPYDPSLATLSGAISLKLGKGRVINLGSSTDTKLGFGRMLNILNLQTLPRRFSLDFTDLFEKGYSFDTMQGHFSLENGNATTKDTFFDGPIARIEIKGKIGMAAKNYDLILSVTPYVTGSIPVVAALAGGPVIGAVSWLVEKAASSVVSSVATYHYSVQGSWDNPVWEKIKAP